MSDRVVVAKPGSLVHRILENQEEIRKVLGITELEKKVEGLHQTYNHGISSLNKKLSELKKNQIEFNHALHTDIDKNIKEIKELKEQIGGNTASSASHTEKIEKCPKCNHYRINEHLVCEKESQPPSIAGSARQTDEFLVGAIYDGIGDFWEAYDLQTENGRLGLAEELKDMINEFYLKNKIVVEKADLEEADKRETWLIEQLYPTHHGNDDFNIHWGKYVDFRKKYLKGDAESEKEGTSK